MRWGCAVRRLEVDRLVVGVHGGLLEGLAERRVGMADASDVLGRGAVLHGEDGLANHLSRVGADDVGAEDLVGLLLDDDLYEPVLVVVCLCPRVGQEGELADLVLDPGLLELRLVPAHPCHLRVRVDDRWNGVVIDVPVSGLEHLDGSEAWCEDGGA